MTTKDIKNQLAQFCELPRTNRFKRAIDAALSQNLPLKLQVARPFKAFRSKAGKCYKARIVNTKTGKAYLAIRTFTRDNGWRTGFLAGGVHYSGVTREEVIKRSGVAEPKDVTTYAHTEEVIGSIGWSDIGFAISKLFQSDMVFFDQCGRCSGKGYIPAFAHISNGICFECLGTGGRLAVNHDEVERMKNKAVTSSAPEV